MKKKITVVALCLALACLFAYGTIAYFTDDTTATNTITAGDLSIALYENDMEVVAEGSDVVAENQIKGGLTFEGFMPTSTAAKKVQVANTSANAAWVRVKVELALTDANGESSTLSTGVFTLDFNATNWVENGGWYYYNTPLAGGDTTAPLFETVTFDKAAGNNYQNTELTITLLAQAVQSANNGTSYDMASGWPQNP